MLKKTTISIILIFSSLMVLTAAALAQGRYTTVYSRQDVSSIINRLETSSNMFRRQFDREMDRSPINGTPEENRYNGYVADYENALDRLRRNFDRRDSWWESRTNVQDVISRAQPVNSMMNSISFRRNIERQWVAMRNDLNRLADTFDLPGLSGGGWNGGPWTPPSGGGRIPSWALGTFYGVDPRTGGPIEMRVASSGAVTLIYSGGSTTYASLNGTTLTNGPYVSRVSQISNGIRTTDVNDRSVYQEYYRTPITGGGPGGYVPSWAVGTFSARDPRTGQNIQMTVSPNGSVSLSYDGGPLQYAYMRGETLTNGPYMSRVTRIRNGIRTTDMTDPSYFIDYIRR